MIDRIAKCWLPRCGLLALVCAAGVGSVNAQMASIDSDAAATDKSPAFSVHKEQQQVTDAFEDFDRYRDKKAWEKAFGALSKVEEGKPGRLVPDKDGFYVPTGLKVRAELLALPPEGREAYRLFNDAKAVQLLKDASAGNDEIGNLTRIVNRYFITSIGDQAADRLGDALFETGDFSNAERCWRLIIDGYPDSAISPVLLQTKRAIALARSGDWNQFDVVRQLLHDRYSGQTAVIAGHDVVAVEFADSLRPATTSPTQGGDRSGNPLGDQTFTAFARQVPVDQGSVAASSDQPAWQIPLMDTEANDHLTAQLGQNGWAGMTGEFTDAIPATVVDDKRIYVNWLGICFAADMKTGKVVWRTESFGDMTTKMSQSIMQGIMIDPQIYNITKVKDQLLFTRRSTENQNYNEAPVARLHCVNADTGAVIWKTDTGPMASWSIVGQPLISDDLFYVIVRPTSGVNNPTTGVVASQEISLLCADLAKGKIRWITALGTPATSMNYRGVPSMPAPTLLKQAGKIDVLTNNGALLQVDITSHQVEWAFTCPTTVDTQPQYYYGYTPAPVMAPGEMLNVGSTLYFKEYKSNLLFALNPADQALKWQRRIDPDNALTGTDGRNLFLMGTEIECVDLDSRTLQWDDKTSVRTGTMQPLVQGDWMYFFGSRGVGSTRLSTGESGPVFRGYDHDSNGGVLWKTSTRLVTVSNRAITAYPTTPQEPGH